MTDFSTLLQQGASNAWLFVPSAILLGALHGLEPGHSKTMMAAFIVAIQGTITQAVLLGLSATLSHTAVVWAVALIGLRLGSGWNSETTEPYLQVASALLIISIAAWMAWRTLQDQRRTAAEINHDHDHGDHGGHAHDEFEGLHVTAPGFKDAHELAHAKDIQRRFSSREVTTGQIVIFGLTGGLIPCPAAITVLILCLQLKQFVLGVALVFCFSIGLAVTMVAAGVIAALSVRHVSSRWSGFTKFAQRAPYFSSALITLVGLYMGYHGIAALMRNGTL